MSKYGLHGDLLMENAGHAVYFVISRDLGIQGRRFAVLSGPGNNGGDSFVVARKLHAGGGKVRVLVMGRARSFTGPARRNLERLEKAGVTPVFRPDSTGIGEALAWCDAVVDGLFGTGVSRDLSRGFREAVEEINGSGKPVFSIDIPSGVDGDTGQPHGVAVQAATTVTFGFPKRGNFLSPGGEMGGRLIVSHISFPPPLLKRPGLSVTLNVPTRPRERERSREWERLARVLFLLYEPGCYPLPESGYDGAVEEGMDCPSSLAPVTFAAVRGRPASVVAPSLLVSPGSTPAGEDAGGPLPSSRSESPQEKQIQGSIPGVDPDSLLVFSGGPDPSITFSQLARDLLTGGVSSILLGREAGAFLPFGAADLRRRRGRTVMILDVEVLAHLSGLEGSQVRRDLLPLLQNWAQELGVIAVLNEDPCLIALPDRRLFIHPPGRGGQEIPGGEALLMGTIGALYDHGLSLEEAVRNGVILFSEVCDGIRGDTASERDSHDPLGALSDVARRYLDDFTAFRSRLSRAVEVI